MARLKAGKRAELESFWRAQLEGWRRSELNQREYCELHGLPLKRFGNWRAKFKHEDDVPRRQLLWRRGGGLSHMTDHMTKDVPPPRPSGYVPSARSMPPGGRRQFGEADKRRIIEEANQPGASVSAVARRHGIAVRQLFRWKQELAPAAKSETAFLPVTVTDSPYPSAEASPLLPAPASALAPVIVERTAPGIEVELIGGRRVRFERDTDPETVSRLVALLEGQAR